MRKILITAGALLVAGGLSNRMQADAYAIAYEEVNNFNLDVSAVSGTWSGTFNRTATEAHVDPIGTTASDEDAYNALQSTEGSAPANWPLPENTYLGDGPPDRVGPQVGTQNSRADAERLNTGTDPGNGTPGEWNKVAESNVQDGGADSQGLIEWARELDTTGGASNTVTISFDATPFMEVIGAEVGDIAQATLSWNITFESIVGGMLSGEQFTWAPDGSAGNVSDPGYTWISNVSENTDPSSLNRSISAFDIDSTTHNGTWSGPPASGSYELTFTLEPGVYQVTYSNSAEVSVASPHSTIVGGGVPEPTTFLLTALGLVGLGVTDIRRRRRS